MLRRIARLRGPQKRVTASFRGSAAASSCRELFAEVPVGHVGEAELKERVQRRFNGVGITCSLSGSGRRLRAPTRRYSTVGSEGYLAARAGVRMGGVACGVLQCSPFPYKQQTLFNPRVMCRFCTSCKGRNVSGANVDRDSE